METFCVQTPDKMPSDVHNQIDSCIGIDSSVEASSSALSDTEQLRPDTVMAMSCGGVYPTSMIHSASQNMLMHKLAELQAASSSICSGKEKRRKCRS